MNGRVKEYPNWRTSKEAMVNADKVLEVYNKVGHGAILCFYHFDHAFQTSKNN